MKKSLFTDQYAAFKACLLFLFLCCLLAPSVLFAQSGKVLFRDDFNQGFLGDEWQAYRSWSAGDGSAHNRVDGIGGTLLTKRALDAPAYVIETAAKGFTNSYWREFRLIFGQVDLNSDSAYVVTYTPNSGGRLTLARATDNILYPEVLDEVVLHPDLKPNKWYKFRIARYESGLIQVYLDKGNGNGYGKTPLLEAIDSTYSKLGHFGWREDTQTSPEDFYVDWIEVRTPNEAKPPVEEKPEADDMITQVSASSGATYDVAKLKAGIKVFTDRDYTVTSVPDYLQGASFIQTANNDKSASDTDFLTMFLKKDAIVYVAYDPRGKELPNWLQDWTKTGDVIHTTDPGSSYYEVYSKSLGYGELYPQAFVLGGNLAKPAVGSEMNYMVIAIEKPAAVKLEAEDATLSGAVVATDHVGYSGTGFVDFINPLDDYIEWNVNVTVAGAYSLGISFSNGREPQRPLELAVDGKQAVVYPFETTYSWESWAYYNGPVVYLTKGAHTIRATAKGFSGPNVDYLTLNYTATTAPAINAVAALDAKRINQVENAARAFAYPNPFQAATTISYTLQERGRVYLAVYNSKGQKVEVLVNKVQEAGTYDVTYSTAALQNGLYIYQLNAGGKRGSGKLLKQ
ncbi:CBM35 domain-containing protein [Pontibacter chitinilyticus]|uniref:CBM35 domain-containing protein n=1 Tax=Pontibacter chitinilyticus TaxID=2674989 RepID=UPI003218FA89